MNSNFVLVTLSKKNPTPSFRSSKTVTHFSLCFVRQWLSVRWLVKRTSARNRWAFGSVCWLSVFRLLWTTVGLTQVAAMLGSAEFSATAVKKKKRPGVVQFRDIVCPTVAFSLDGIHMRLFSSRVCFHRARWRRYHGRWPPPTFVQDNEEEQEPPLSHTVSPLWRRPCVYLLSWVTENHLSSDRCCWLFTSLRKEIH